MTNAQMAGDCAAAVITAQANSYTECESEAERGNPYCAASVRAEQVREAHLKELLAIHGVVGVGTRIGRYPGDVVIQLFVMDPKDLRAVERAAPRVLDGIDVEVELVQHGYN